METHEPAPGGRSKEEVREDQKRRDLIALHEYSEECQRRMIILEKQKKQIAHEKEEEINQIVSAQKQLKTVHDVIIRLMRRPEDRHSDIADRDRHKA